MRRIRWLLLLAAIFFLAGCGEKGGSSTAPDHPAKLREVRVSINDNVGAEHAGLLMAEANGYFAEVGLEVVVDPPATPTWPIRYLLSDLVDSDISVSHLPQVAIAIENKLPIIAVGSLISKPNAALIWLRGSGIESVSDLKGKVVAIPGLPFQARIVEHLLSRAGLGIDDVKIKYVSFELAQTLASGKADAIFGGSPQIEGIELRSLGKKPVVTPVQSEEVPSYNELVLITTNEFAAKETQLIKNFMGALSRGTAAAARNPHAVIREIENNPEPRPVSRPKTREEQVKATLPLLSKTNYMDPAQARRMIDWMHREGMLRQELPVSKLLTDEYLPNP